jgi:hypothetical protein
MGQKIIIPNGLAQVHPQLEIAFKSIQGVLDDLYSKVGVAKGNITTTPNSVPLPPPIPPPPVPPGSILPLIQIFSIASLPESFPVAVYETSPGTCALASNAAASTSQPLLGVATTQASAGKVYVIVLGDCIYSGWSWTATNPVYLGTDGGLTQDLPDVQQPYILGYATSSTSIYVDPQLPPYTGDSPITVFATVVGYT